MSTYFNMAEWQVSESDFDASRLTLAETIFNQANGYIGTRATFEEGVEGNPSSCEGTYLNGLYVRIPIHYEENAYGLAMHNHKMLQVPDGKSIRLLIDGQRFVPTTANCLEHERQLDFKTGLLTRRTVWQVDVERKLEISVTRLVSLSNQHTMAIRYEVTPLNFAADIHLESRLDAAYGQQHIKDEQDPRAGHLSITDQLDLIDYEASQERLRFLHHIRGGEKIVTSACCHHSDGLRFVSNDKDPLHEMLISHYETRCEMGETVRLHKYICYHDAGLDERDRVEEQIRQSLGQAKDLGFEALAHQQKEMLDGFWDHTDVEIDGDVALQQGIRFSLFQLFQSAGKDGERNIGAKGLSGPGYDGHYFWDTEIYIIPLFIFTNPTIARSLLYYRYSLLDASRKRAREMGHPSGALYAWRTIGGEECSAFFPAGSAQYHINAAIAYALMQYVRATDDWEMMRHWGAELLFETARIWVDMGHFSQARGGAFCINEVTGPDEYSAMVDNNFYTNAMARHHLHAACEVATYLKTHYPADHAGIFARIGLHEEELALWQRAADQMLLPFDESARIHIQDDGFLSKPRWDFDHTPQENYPLLLHYHPLVIYRHQVLKQADVVLAMMLLGHEFENDVRRNNLAYYTPLTTHDSTLSTCIYSIESSRAGLASQAYSLFEETARMDLENRHHNTEYGLHTACMAGSWQTIVMGFAGLEMFDQQLHLAPYLPQRWQRYRFSLKFRHCRLKVSVGEDAVSFKLEEGDRLTIQCYGEPVELSRGEPAHIPLQPLEQAA